jgi:hypothetical protein
MSPGDAAAQAQPTFPKPDEREFIKICKINDDGNRINLEKLLRIINNFTAKINQALQQSDTAIKQQMKEEAAGNLEGVDGIIQSIKTAADFITKVDLSDPKSVAEGFDKMNELDEIIQAARVKLYSMARCPAIPNAGTGCQNAVMRCATGALETVKLNKELSTHKLRVKRLKEALK